jgi:membrane-bound lytic murein transglycosylase MltF
MMLSSNRFVYSMTVAVLVMVLGMFVSVSAATAPTATAPDDPRQDSSILVEKILQPWRGDLDGMNQRRAIRVLVTFNKMGYFFDKGQPSGATHDLFIELEKYWNQKTNSGTLKKNIIFVPVRRDQLLPYLLEGKGDIAASNLTITQERLEDVDFVNPLYSGVKEVIVTGPESPALKTVDDLSGQSVMVRKSSSYYASLTEQNEKFKSAGKPLITILPADENLEDDDLLDMVNAGLIPITLVDTHVAEFWVQLLPDLKVHPDIALRQNGQIAWAVRKDSPKLKAFLNEFIPTVKKGSMLGNILYKRYFQSTKYAERAASPANRKRLLSLIGLFQKYGEQYHFDWILLAAQGYQESQLNQELVSPAGAVGVMQVKPSTAEGEPVFIKNIKIVENNIHAGAKFMAFIRETYFNDDKVDDFNKQLFCLASYNAGPTRIARLRQQADKMGLDPNKWFQNVEVVAAKEIGRETVQYVSNILKYYVAYKQVIESRDEREKARALPK